MGHVWAVVMAGGSGTRFWPLSRRHRPKQFLAIGTPRTLIEETIARLSPLVPPERAMVVAGEAHAPMVRALLPDQWLVTEPCARNTAPCVGLAALHVRRRDPNGVLAVLPSDHHIGDASAYRRHLQAALERAAQGEIVTLGIRPDRPETGYGYIHYDRQDTLATRNGVQACAVKRFVEKPPRAVAERYLAEGGYLWNSGMFFFTVARLFEDLRRFLPALASALDEIDRALDRGEAEGARVTAEVFAALESISLDYGVMEHADRVRVVPSDFGWNDVGHWAALADFGEADAEGNVRAGADTPDRPVLFVDAHGNIVQRESDRLVALVGVRDLVVVDTPDALLVCHRDQVQEVRKVVARLEALKLEALL